MPDNIIKVLTPDIVAKIAAGEVIERPASVVKELIENSIDAGSTEITVHIEKAGLELVQIADNGKGMSREDAELAFEAHSTSKISRIEDLDKLITLGFRGEALASIAAVADVEMDTSNEKDKTNIKIINGKTEVGDSNINKGTNIQVKMLFNRVPARKKFLRSEATESKHIQDIFLKHAIINPQIHFRLINNGKEIYNLPSTDSLKTRIFDIWGGKIAKGTQEVYYDSPNLKISGLIGHPELARRDRSMQFIFLNKRPIMSNLIGKAVEDAFHATKPDSHNPIFFIDLALDPKEVDVNVHPRKMEVKFGNTGQLYSAVKHTVDKHLSNLLQNGVKQHFVQTISAPAEYKQAEQSTTRPFTFAEKSIKYNKPRKQDPLINQSLEFSKLMLGQEPSIAINQTTFVAKQFFDTFIIVQNEDKLLFIDQHAADERVKYEKLLKQTKEKEPIPVQRLLVPQTIELDQAKYDLFLENMDLFNSIGLDIEPFGRNTLKLSSIPSVLGKFDFQKFVEEVLERDIIELNKNEVLHEVIATMACHGSIRAGRKMQPIEVQKLIEDLFKCEKPYSCPHGRPIIWEMKKYEIEKKFKRTGFC